MTQSSPIALISGASSGIGEALAKCFARAGYNLVLVARRADKLRELAKSLSAEHGIQAWVSAADLSQVDAPAKLFASLKRAKRPIDVLVNCAGVLHHGPFVAMDVAKHHMMIDLNVTGLTAMVAQFAPDMVARGSGRILNVASIAAFQPIPSLATYAATKAYVLSFTESLSQELKGTGVTITALCPGITATAMISGAQSDSPQLNHLPQFLIGQAAQVAQDGFDACMRGDTIKVPGLINHATTLASRATPKWLVRAVGGAFTRAMK